MEINNSIVGSPINRSIDRSRGAFMGLCLCHAPARPQIQTPLAHRQREEVLYLLRLEMTCFSNSNEGGPPVLKEKKKHGEALIHALFLLSVGCTIVQRHIILIATQGLISKRCKIQRRLNPNHIKLMKLGGACPIRSTTMTYDNAHMHKVG